ncbi:MAG: septum formation inhibitor Maf [Proteobacteria bacterium]|nr:septum formation inhibitor Maf [Pseudomonadota bacterium]
MIILASGSPRRKQLLSEAGVTVITEPADIDEHPLEHEPPVDYARRMASEKARAAAAHHLNESVFIIAADTSVVLDGVILGKPASQEHAIEMLNNLSGREHQVLTGVCVLNVRQNLERCFVSETSVFFTHLSQARIMNYIRTGEPMDKAGAYGIQGRAAGFVSHIEGSYTNVVGLPLCETLAVLEEMGAIAF